MAMTENRCPNCDRPFAPDGTPWGDKSLCYTAGKEVRVSDNTTWITWGEIPDLDKWQQGTPGDECNTHKVNWQERATRARETLTCIEAPPSYGLSAYGRAEDVLACYRPAVLKALAILKGKTNG